MKGFPIKLALPTYIYDYLQHMTQKMSTVPISNPETKELLLNPTTNQSMPMINTGQIEELLHQCILTSIYPLVRSHPAFEEERKTIETFREEYGKYITSIVQNYFITNTEQKPVKKANAPKKD